MEYKQFSADRPIDSIEEDLLDRREFSESLAGAVSGWTGKDSLIVALHGEWGSGKTSVKNMMLSIFEHRKEQGPLVVEFNPWEWAVQDKISKSFFESMASVLGQADKGGAKKKIAKKLRQYALYLQSGELLATGLTAVAPIFVLVLSILGFGGMFLEEHWLKNVFNVLFVVAMITAAALKWGGKALKTFSGLAEEHAVLDEQSLEELKASLAADLRCLKSPVLVIIDDVDRLSSEETRIVFQLVKANADFPNFVYLMLFQRDIVEQRLNDAGQNGRDYLEKIVQVPFDIPKLEQGRLEKILFSNLDRILEEDEKILRRFDKLRWGNMFYGGLFQYFRTLRSIYRFSSTLSFYVSLLKGHSAFEVNPIDLIAMECLRVFEPDVYLSISRSKDLLTTIHASPSVKTREHAKRRFDNIVGQAAEERRESVKHVVLLLFPSVETVLESVIYSGYESEEWFKELRVCHPDVFGRYFQFSIPEGDISQSDLDQVISLSGDRDTLVQKLDEYREASLLAAVLRQLDSYKQDIPLKDSDSFVPALMDIGDVTENESGGLMGMSAHAHLVRIVLWYLRQEKSLETRGRMLLSAFSQSNGLSVMARILGGDAGRREKKENAELLMLDDKMFDVATREFVVKLQRAAKSEPDALLSNDHLESLLWAWAEWGDVEEIRTWLFDNVTSYEALLNLLDKFASRVVSTVLGDHMSNVEYKIKLDNVEHFFPLDRLMDLWRSGEAGTQILSERERRTLIALKDAINERKKGGAK